VGLVVEFGELPRFLDLLFSPLSWKVVTKHLPTAGVHSHVCEKQIMLKI